MNTLRTQCGVQAQQISRLESEKAVINRQSALVTAQEHSARSTLRAAESRNRAMRDEIARLKANVSQVRAQCATDLRRRDAEIARMKRHVEGRRGREAALGNHTGSMVITAGQSKANGVAKAAVFAEDALYASPESLREDTAEFLTRLSQSLSDENDALIGLISGTLATLKSLQGFPEGNEAHCSVNQGSTYGGLAQQPMVGPPAYDMLAKSTDEVLEHLRGLLTNPSFVPLEEVIVREEEIQRLREGWEKMAVRWKEAVGLMDGWKRRIVDEGDTINLEDLKTGLRLGNGIPTAQEARISPSKFQSAAPNSETSEILQEPPNIDVSDLQDTDLASSAIESNSNSPFGMRALKETNQNIRPVRALKLDGNSASVKNASVGSEEQSVALSASFNGKDRRPSSSKGLKSNLQLQVGPTHSRPTFTYGN